MATLTIQKRTTPSGETRFVVRYRLGGRDYPVLHGGSFKTRREATIRRELIAAELAAGRHPAATLRELVNPKPKRTGTLAYETWRESRLDLDPRTIANCDGHWKRLSPTFGELALDEITSSRSRSGSARTPRASGS